MFRLMRLNNVRHGSAAKNIWWASGLLLCAATFLLVGCGGGSSTAAQNSGPLAGNWQLTLASPADQSFVGTTDCTADPKSTALCMGGFLQQSSSSVTGQFTYAVSLPATGGGVPTLCNAGSGPVSGTVNGQGVTLSVTAGNQSFKLTGNLSSDGTTMSGTYDTTDGKGCGTAQTGLQWTAVSVPPLSGQVQGVFHSVSTVLGMVNQDFAVTGSLSQSPNIGASNATVTGTLNFDAYPCLGTASVNGQISGSSIILQIFADNGANSGTIGARAGFSNPSPVTYRNTQSGYILQGINGYGVTNRACPGGNTPGDEGNVCLNVGNATACTQPILLSPPLLNFLIPQEVGSAPTSQTITITNNDPSGATLSGLTIGTPETGPVVSPPSQFWVHGFSDFSGLPSFTERDNCSSAPSAPFSLGPQKSCTVTISFSPQQSCPWLPNSSSGGLAPVLCPSPVRASLVVNNPQNINNTGTDNNSAFAAPLTGYAFSTLAPITLISDPAGNVYGEMTGELDFGSVALSESSPPQTLTFTNQGSHPVQVLPALSSPPCGSPLHYAALLRPVAPGTASDFQVVLGGATTLPIPDQPNSTVDYVCDIDPGSQKPNFQLSNDTCAGTIVPPLGTCSVDVTLVPQPQTSFVSGYDAFLELNTLQCTDSVTSDCEVDSGRFPVELKVNTGSPLRMSPAASADFGLQPLGLPVAPLTVKLFNDPKDPNAQTITFAGNRLVNTDFTETDDCGTGLAPGASCTLTFTFVPRFKGLDQGTFTIGYPVGQTQTIYLRGTGYSPVQP